MPPGFALYSIYAAVIRERGALPQRWKDMMPIEREAWAQCERAPGAHPDGMKDLRRWLSLHDERLMSLERSSAKHEGRIDALEGSRLDLTPVTAPSLTATPDTSPNPE
jgi:hypothetical protein